MYGWDYIYKERTMWKWDYWEKKLFRKCYAQKLYGEELYDDKTKWIRDDVEGVKYSKREFI